MDRKILTALLSVGLLALLPLAASAVTVSLTPETIRPGEQVTISFTGLPDGAPVSIGISGDFTVVPGNAFSFEISNFNIPFGLANGSIFAGLQNTRTNALEIRSGSANVKYTGDSVSGQYMKTLPFNVAPGIYDYFRLSGTAATDTISTDIRISGLKTGPDEGDITFNVGGLENGLITVTILVNNGEVLVRTIPVESDQTSTPTPTGTGTEVPTGEGMDGGSGGRTSDGSSAATTTTIPMTANITTTATESPVVTTSVLTTVLTAEETVTTPGQTTARPSTTRAGFGMLLPCTAGLAVALFLLSRR